MDNDVLKNEPQVDISLLQLVLTSQGEVSLRIAEDIIPYINQTNAKKIERMCNKVSDILYTASEKSAIAGAKKHKEDLKQFQEEMLKANENYVYDEQAAPVSAVLALQEASKKHWTEERFSQLSEKEKKALIMGDWGKTDIENDDGSEC